MKVAKGNGWMVVAMMVITLAALFFQAIPVQGAESGDSGSEVKSATNLHEALRVIGLALAAAIAMAVAGLATAKAQSAVGSGGTGALAEKPELFTSILILFALPETIVVLGFVIAFLLIRQI